MGGHTLRQGPRLVERWPGVDRARERVEPRHVRASDRALRRARGSALAACISVLGCQPDPHHLGDLPPIQACATEDAELIAGICFESVARVFDVSIDPAHVVHGDFVADPHVDLIAVGIRDGSVGAELWVGSSAGPDIPPIDPMLTGCSAFPVAGPLLSSGRQDVVFSTCGPSVSVYPGGDLAFGQPVSIELPLTGRSAVVGDVEGDGDADLVVLGEDAGGGVALTAMLRQASGEFGTPSLQPLSPVAFDASGISAADLDGDGVLDLVLRNPALPGALSYARGIGDGTFADPTLLPTELRPSTLATADLDGDGDEDLAFADNDVAAVCVWITDGSQDPAPECKLTEGFLPTSIAAGDLDDDGTGEIVLADATLPTLWIWDVASEAAVDDLDQLSLPAPADLVDLADFNGDGRLDILAAHFGSRALSIRFEVP